MKARSSVRSSSSSRRCAGAKTTPDATSCVTSMLSPSRATSRPVIGTPELITPLARETLVAYYRRHYVPEAFTLVVVVTSTATPSLLLPVARSVACRAAAPVAHPFLPHRRRKRDDWRCHAPVATPTWGSRGSLPPSIMPTRQPSISSSPSSGIAGHRG